MSKILAISPKDLARLFPMYLEADTTCKIVDLGPTLAKVLPRDKVCGRNVFDIFKIKHRHTTTEDDELADLAGGLIRVTLVEPPHPEFKATVVP